jgi:hypothetical protein
MPSRIATPMTPAVVEPDGLLQALERPHDLLKLSDETFSHLVDAFLDQGAPVMAAIKRGSGILAWAARHHLPNSHYGAWLHQFASTLGVHDDSVVRWRDRAISELNLPVATATAERSQARLAGARKARSRLESVPTPAAVAAAAVLAPAIVGGTAPARRLVEDLLELSAEDLADSASTEELRSLKDLIDAALAEQQRIALRARVAQKEARGRRRVG